MNKRTLKWLFILLTISVGLSSLLYFAYKHYFKTSPKEEKTEVSTPNPKPKPEPLFNTTSSFVLNFDINPYDFDETIDRAIEVIKKRLESYGINNAEIKQQDTATISVNIPGIVDIYEIGGLITNNDKLAFRIVKTDKDSFKALNKIEKMENPFNNDGTLTEEAKKMLPKGTTVMKNKEGAYLAVADIVIDEKTNLDITDISTAPLFIVGDDFEEIKVVKDQYDYPNIFFKLNNDSAKKFEDLTSRNVGRQLAIVFGNTILSAPVILNRISAEGQISGQFTESEAQHIASILNSAPLPTTVRIIKKGIICS